MNPPASHTPRHALVTGGSGRIGRAIAHQLARDGYRVTVHCRSRVDEAQAVADAIQTAGGEADWIAFDVSDRSEAGRLLEAKVAADGPYHCIVCNAGITRDGAFPALSGEDWDQVLGVGLDGFFNVVQPLLIPMIKTRSGGRIVCISSVSGVVGNRGQVNYSAAKAGLIGAAKALAVEAGQPRDHRELHRSRTDRIGAGGRAGARTCHAGHPHEPGRPARGCGRPGGLPLFGVRGLHHPPGHRRERGDGLMRRVVVTGMGGRHPLRRDLGGHRPRNLRGPERREGHAAVGPVPRASDTPRRAHRGLRGPGPLPAEDGALHGPRGPPGRPRHGTRPAGRRAPGRRDPGRWAGRCGVWFLLRQRGSHRVPGPQSGLGPDRRPQRHGLHPGHEPHGRGQYRSLFRPHRPRHSHQHRLHQQQPGHRLRLRMHPGRPPDRHGGRRIG